MQGAPFGQPCAGAGLCGTSAEGQKPRRSQTRPEPRHFPRPGGPCHSGLEGCVRGARQTSIVKVTRVRAGVDLIVPVPPPRTLPAAQPLQREPTIDRRKGSRQRGEMLVHRTCHHVLQHRRRPPYAGSKTSNRLGRIGARCVRQCGSIGAAAGIRFTAWGV